MEKSAYIDHPFESFFVSDIFETMLIVSAGVAGPLPAFDVPVADSRGVAVIVVVVLKDAIMPEASIRRCVDLISTIVALTTADLVIRSSDLIPIVYTNAFYTPFLPQISQDACALLSFSRCARFRLGEPSICK